MTISLVASKPIPCSAPAELGTIQLAQTYGLRYGRAGDRAALDRGFAELSERSRYLRFFSPIRQLPPDLLDRLSNVDRTNRVAVVAFPLDDPDHLVGVVRFFRDIDQPSEAEVSLTVLDDYQGVGLASAMYDSCVSIALEQGINVFTGYVLAENQPMLRFFRKRDAQISRDPDDASVLRVRLDLS